MPTEKSLFNSFLEMENKVCHNCYFHMFTPSRVASRCRNCEMQKFKETLRKYCDNREDDGR